MFALAMALSRAGRRDAPTSLKSLISRMIKFGPRTAGTRRFPSVSRLTAPATSPFGSAEQGIVVKGVGHRFRSFDAEERTDSPMRDRGL
jgi:hypothetical protein